MIAKRNGSFIAVATIIALGGCLCLMLAGCNRGGDEPGHAQASALDDVEALINRIIARVNEGKSKEESSEPAGRELWKSKDGKIQKCLLVMDDKAYYLVNEGAGWEERGVQDCEFSYGNRAGPNKDFFWVIKGDLDRIFFEMDGKGCLVLMRSSLRVGFLFYSMSGPELEPGEILEATDQSRREFKDKLFSHFLSYNENQDQDQLKIYVDRFVKKILPETALDKVITIGGDDIISFDFELFDFEIYDGLGTKYRFRNGIGVELAEDGYTVVSVEPESLAMDWGVEKGDIVYCGMSDRLAGILDLPSTLKTLPPGYPAQFGVRKSKNGEATFYVYEDIVLPLEE